jgi:hypothetical protein
MAIASLPQIPKCFLLVPLAREDAHQIKQKTEYLKN